MLTIGDTLRVYLWAGGAIAALFTLLWMISLVIKDASIVDSFWSVGFLLAGWVYLWLSPHGAPPRQALLLGMLALWGIRLALYIYLRNRGSGEDYRYQTWRGQYGQSWWWRSFFQVFLLQGVLCWVISAPLYPALSAPHPRSLTWLDGAGGLAWLVGFLFEAIGDWQLAKFRKQPESRGKVLQTGLWKYTRHPNYFGEAVLWWGYYLVAGAAGGWWSIFSPLLMTYLLLRVSGVAMLEKTITERRPEYLEYMQRTSVFVPLPPKKPKT